jgi:hypothetical protein
MFPADRPARQNAGMTTDQQTPSTLAYDAAEAIRGINHLTYNADSLPYPGNISSVLGGLDQMAGRLPQALSQLRRRLDQLHASGHLYSQGGPEDLPQAMKEYRAWLATATAAADSLQHALAEAHNQCASLGYRD